MINAQINQPAMNKQAMPNQTMVNLAQPNQMMNQSAKMPQINQILANPQQPGGDVNQQMIDPNGNMNPGSNMNPIMIGQVTGTQIITQNQQAINQAPNHMQPTQPQMQRVPLQANRMIITSTQVRPGQIINQNFHARGMRPTQPNVQMQQQPNEQYFQQQNQQAAGAPQSINPQAMNQQQAMNNQAMGSPAMGSPAMNSQPMNAQPMNQQPQFQQVQQQQFQPQQTNVPMQQAGNMNQMTIQMAPSPSSYAPSPSTMMSSPMSVSMIQQQQQQAPQRTGGPPSVPSNPSPNPTLNTPQMNASSSPQMRHPTNDEQMYREKLRQLSKYIEPLKKLIIKNENSDNPNSSKETQKIKSLLDIINDPTKRGVQYELLLRCESVLEKMDFKTNLVSTSTPIKTFTVGPNVNVCAPLMEAIQNNYRKPNFNHTLQRTIGPAVAAITNNSLEQAYKRTAEETLPEEEIPHTVQGEVAKLDSKFFIELDPLQHPQSKTIHMICKIDDVDLPCVPPISIKVPMDYPNLPPRCYINKQEYSSSKFLQDIYRIFNSNLEKLSNLYSITTLLDRWELSIREALNL